MKFPLWVRPMWHCIGCCGAILIWLGIHVEHIGFGDEPWREQVADICERLGDVLQDVGAWMRNLGALKTGKLYPIPEIWDWDDL